MSKQKEHLFDNVIALDGIPVIEKGHKGVITGLTYRSINVLWSGRVIPVSYDRLIIEGKLKADATEPSPTKRVSKRKKTDVTAAG